MATMPSQSDPQTVGGPSGSSSLLSSSATKRRRPSVMDHQVNLVAKRGTKVTNQQKSPTSSTLKRPPETSQQKQPSAKRFKPPLATRSPMVTSSPMMRILVSPLVMTPSTPRSPQSSPALPPPSLERLPSPAASPPPSSSHGHAQGEGIEATTPAQVYWVEVVDPDDNSNTTEGENSEIYSQEFPESASVNFEEFTADELESFGIDF